jgi:hypothetical protein
MLLVLHFSHVYSIVQLFHLCDNLLFLSRKWPSVSALATEAVSLCAKQLEVKWHGSNRGYKWDK